MKKLKRKLIDRFDFLWVGDTGTLEIMWLSIAMAVMLLLQMFSLI